MHIQSNLSLRMPVVGASRLIPKKKKKGVCVGGGGGGGGRFENRIFALSFLYERGMSK